MSSKISFLPKTALCAVFALTLVGVNFAQAKKPKPTPNKPAVAGPKVTQIDIEGLKTLIKPKGKPLLINFWATWCDPCREEFPDLVKIDAAYKGKIDFVTVSLDDLADISTLVPKFLNEVKATMPAYLLKTPDESAAITMVAKDWSGNLPMTVLYAASGEAAYIKMGKITHEGLTAEIDKVLNPAQSVLVESTHLKNEPLYSYDKGIADAEKEIAEGKFRIIRYGMRGGANTTPEFEALKKKYSFKITEMGCVVFGGFPEYAKAFNKAMRDGFVNKFGEPTARLMGMSSLD